MIPVLDAGERDRLLDFLRHRLLAPLLEAGGPAPAGALAEAAALLALPGARDRDPALAGRLSDALAGAGNPARLDIVAADPRCFAIETGWARLTGDLSRGEVVETRPGPSGPVELRHTGNLVEFRARGRRHCLDVEDGIAGFGLERRGEEVVLHHETPLSVPGRWPWRKAPAPVAVVRYEYRLRADRPALRLDVTLRALAGLRGARLTTAWDELGARGLAFRAARAERGGTREAWGPVGEAGASRLFAGPLDHLALPAESGPVLHAWPRDPAAVLGVTGHPRPGGALHWVVTRHAVGALSRGAAASRGEERLLAPGDLPDEALARLRDGREPEPPPPAEAAVTLDALATRLLFAGPGEAAALRAAYADGLERLWPRLTAGEAAALAWTACSLDAAARATGEARYAERLAEAGARLAAPPWPGDRPEEAALRLLALARIALHGLSVPGMAVAAARGLAVWSGFLPDSGPDSAPPDSALAGLALRAFSALRLAARRGALALPPGALGEAESLTAALLPRLQAVARDRGAAGVQILPRPGATEDSPPDLLAQLRVTLGLLHPEAAIAARPPVPAERPRGGVPG